MFDINKLTRENVKALQAYKVWRDDYLDDPSAIFLDNCENNFGSPLGKGYERYPSSSQSKLKTTIADYKNITGDKLITGNGSDELIDLLIRCFCNPGKDNILICEPTFGMFRVYAQLNDVTVLNAPLTKTTFLVDEELILNTITAQTKLIFICSPNNPTGTSIRPEQVKTIAESFDGLLIVDEAYIDFSDKASALTLIHELPNLVVLQTFSKAWGLAALRVGVAYAGAEIIAILNKARPPFNINTHSQELVIKALEHPQRKDLLVEQVLTQKRILKTALSGFSFIKNIVKSDANYFLIATDEAARIFQYLLSRNILISDRSALLQGEGYLRISVGNEAENQALIETLKQINL